MIATGHDELSSETTRCAHELRTPGGGVGPPSYAAPQAPHPGSRATGMVLLWEGGTGRIWDFAGWCVVWLEGQSLKMTQGFLVCPEPRTSQQGSAVAGGAGAALGGHCWPRPSSARCST